MKMQTLCNSYPLPLPYSHSNSQFQIPKPPPKPRKTLKSFFLLANKPSQTQNSIDDTSKEPPKFELLGKPSPIFPPPEPEQPHEPEQDEEEALAPFLKFFKSRDSQEPSNSHDFPPKKVQEPQPREADQNVEYYDPKAGDFAVGVVVSGNENKMDVSIGADFLGTMLTKEAMPMYQGELEYLLCDVEKEGPGLGRGKMGVVREEDAMGETKRVPGRPVVEAGTVVFAEVLGRTLSGRPLLSSRRMYRRVAWHRVRQVLFSNI